jgi:hypothetical protein
MYDYVFLDLPEGRVCMYMRKDYSDRLLAEGAALSY